MKETESDKDSEVQNTEDDGIDIPMLEDNLRLSPEEKLLRHQQALDLVFELEDARRVRLEI
ncbi:MAG: hypothetical protein HY391_04655 [Deltaproteobacteria bacterium]|nr:hypothetical protein [Deltaproteobacteria bacterium]